MNYFHRPTHTWYTSTCRKVKGGKEVCFLCTDPTKVKLELNLNSGEYITESQYNTVAIAEGSNKKAYPILLQNHSKETLDRCLQFIKEEFDPRFQNLATKKLFIGQVIGNVTNTPNKEVITLSLMQHYVDSYNRKCDIDNTPEFKLIANIPLKVCTLEFLMDWCGFSVMKDGAISLNKTMVDTTGHPLDKLNVIEKIVEKEVIKIKEVKKDSGINWNKVDKEIQKLLHTSHKTMNSNAYSSFEDGVNATLKILKIN